nr:hypothetical protein KPHV_81040 [Kitasatospora purpeofusca]
MSVLVGALGDALAATQQVSRVLTLAPGAGRDLSRGLVTRLGAEHWLLRIPAPGAGAVDPAAAPELRAALAWWITRLLALPGARPAVVHARFADDGSLAVADAAGGSGARFAFTATPDPHRTMGELHRKVGRSLRTESAAAVRVDLHRVFAADVLADRCDLLVTIPGRAGGRAPTRWPSTSRSSPGRSAAPRRLVGGGGPSLSPRRRRPSPRGRVPEQAVRRGRA